MISASQVRKGLALEYRNDVFEVVDFQHVKPGKGAAFVKVKLKSMTTERVLEDSLRPEDKLEELFMEEKKYQYLYRQGDQYVFMDLTSFEQIELSKQKVEHLLPYLLENMEVSARENEGRLFGLSLPNTVELRITETAPNYKGDTSGGGKPATMETGATVTVPFFLDPDDVIRVDTRTGEYLGRAKE